MRIRNILCPVDFSDDSLCSLEHAERLASEYSATLHIVFVHDIGIPGVGYTMPGELEKSKNQLDSTLPASTVPSINRQLLLGEPVEEICKYVSQNQIDLILISTHGRTGLKRLLMGSVAEEVLRRATCPVMTIRIPAEVETLQT